MRGKVNTIHDILLRLVVCEPATLPTGCWEWPMARSQRGYGLTSIGNSKQVRVHRAVYEHFVGPIPPDMEPDHLCGNRACANFEHIEPLTRAGHRRRHSERQTHCKRGHPLSGDNLIPNPKQRRCRACSVAATRRYREKRKDGDVRDP